MSNKPATKTTPMQKLKGLLNVESVKTQFQNALKENAGPFIASIIDLYGSDKYLQQCDPNAVIMEALKAATLKLPINKQLGFAYIVPYKSKGVSIPQFQLGYKGYIQLAMRTGQYKFLNAGIIREGIKVERNILTGQIEFTGEPTSEKPQGYFAYMELLNGFSKTVYMTKEEVTAHAKRYSKSYNLSNSAWKTNFDEMAMKTVIRLLLSKYGILSTDMISVLTTDRDGDVESEVANEIANEANKETIDVEYDISSEETGESPPEMGQESEPVEQQVAAAGPGF
ncbi:recombinase RecT [Desulfoscipio geothermicus]|uniref:Recombination protein RecT n=1 Tax=Desulfoscipio geothermicus DSM 3669 TaxID=1121426 RepID=A0A1I6ECZ2_9FIRM|nr:recombinase RecT [Desulfoscipio geothermicus]SFR15378.1 recombination protein RecT [Desulfoscipio geothermicus DSM 3669]